MVLNSRAKDFILITAEEYLGFFVMSISKVIFHFSCENVEKKIMCIRTKYSNTLFKILFN